MPLISLLWAALRSTQRLMQPLAEEAYAMAQQASIVAARLVCAPFSVQNKILVLFFWWDGEAFQHVFQLVERLIVNQQFAAITFLGERNFQTKP